MACGDDDGGDGLKVLSPSLELVQTLVGHDGPVWCVTVSPSGSHLASGGYDEKVMIWSEPGEGGEWARVQVLEDNTGGIKSVCFSPDGKQLATGSYDTSINLYSFNEGSAILANTLEGHTGTVYSLSFSPDCKLLCSGSYLKSINFWNPADGSLVKSIDQAHTSSVRSVSYTPNGRVLVSAAHDNTMKIWDADTLELNQTFTFGGDFGYFKVTLDSDSDSDSESVFIVRGSSNKVRIQVEALKDKKELERELLAAREKKAPDQVAAKEKKERDQVAVMEKLKSEQACKHALKGWAAREKKEQKERRKREAEKEKQEVVVKERQEQKEWRDQFEARGREAARENQEQAKIEAEQAKIEDLQVAEEAKTATRKKQEQKERREQVAAKSKWLRFGYSLSKKESIRETWVFALEFHELERRKQVAAKSKWLRFGYSLNKKESVRETWVLALEFHELCLSRRPTAPPEVIIFRYVSKWLTSRKTKKFLKKEFVGYLTYYVNQRLGESNQDVFRGYATSYDNIEGVEKVTPCAIKKIRASEVASVGELKVMKKALKVKCVNVLELHAVVTTDEYVFLAVELCEGCLGRGDFFDKFKRSISERLELCRQIVVGVNHLHAIGVWHRDIKPGNVLFKQVSERAFWKTSILAMKCAKWLQT